jgi:hypothetical protein
MIIRLYIDGLGGVTLDDCVHISRQMNNSMDIGLKESDFEPQKRAHSTQLAAGSLKTLGHTIWRFHLQVLIGLLRKRLPLKGLKDKLLKLKP